MYNHHPSFFFLPWVFSFRLVEVAQLIFREMYFTLPPPAGLGNVLNVNPAAAAAGGDHGRTAIFPAGQGSSYDDASAAAAAATTAAPAAAADHLTHSLPGVGPMAGVAAGAAPAEGLAGAASDIVPPVTTAPSSGSSNFLQLPSAGVMSLGTHCSVFQSFRSL